MYRPDTLKLRPNVPPELEAATRKDLAGYYAHCTALDDALAELLQALRESGQAGNTIFLFTADHGDMLGSQGMARKQKPYEESVRVPMLIRWPAGYQGGRAVDAPISTEDVMPTLVSLAGLPIPPSADGLSYAEFLRGGTDPSDGAALIACPSPFGEWDLNGPWLHFDNTTDPYQQHNLAGQPEHAKLQAEMEERLQKKLRAAHDDFRPGPEYLAKWKWQVNENGTAATAP
jgi:arylsulfatase A-like enzyme